MVKLKAILPDKPLGVANQTPYLQLDSQKDSDTDAEILIGKAVVVFDPFTGLPVNQVSTVYRNVTTLAAGSTALWTAPAGKRWRLLGLQVTLLQQTTAAAACVLTILDVAAVTGIGITLGIAALTAVPTSTIVLDLRCINVLAANPGTALNINLSSVLAVQGLSVQCWGVEE